MLLPALVRSLARYRLTATAAFTPTPATATTATTTRLLLSSSSSSSSSNGTAVTRRIVSKEERAALRAARKKEATEFVKQQQLESHQTTDVAATAAAAGGQKTAFTNRMNAGAIAATGATKSSTTSSSSTTSKMLVSRHGWVIYGGVPILLTGLAVWAANDADSPPAKFSEMIGLTKLITNFTQDFAKPAHEKLLPDWSQMPNVPHDIPIPHTLVLDLENTLIGSQWDRKYGWRHAKRPGVEKFLRDLAQYYEIVLYTPSFEGLAAPVVDALDKDQCILHRLYREATHFHNGVHVKDLSRLNRDIKRMIVIDDDPAEVQFNPENLIRVKPYTDITDQTDNTLARITPFLLEIAREGYNDIPALLRQYQGLDADGIADEQERRLERLKHQRNEIRQRSGLGSLAAKTAAHLLEAPELPPATFSANAVATATSRGQLTAKDIAGRAPTPSSWGEDAPGLMGFLNRRAKEKEEHHLRKMEKWQEVMMKKHKEREAKAKATAAAAAS